MNITGVCFTTIVIWLAGCIAILMMCNQPAFAAGPDPDIFRLKLLPPGPDNPRNGDPTFITLKDGRILMVYSHFTGKVGTDESPCHLAGRYSSDGGKTWTKDDVLIVSSKESKMGNVMSPSLLRLHDGRIALFYLRINSMQDDRPIMRISTDEGKTWSEPTICIPDSEIGFYILNNDRAIQLKSGRLVLPVARHDDLSKPNKWNDYAITMCYLSDDAGKTWRRSKTMLNEKRDLKVALQEPGVIQLRDNRLMMFCRTHTGYVYRSFSNDDGETWTAPHKYPGLYAPVSAPAIERIPTTGDLLLVWNNHEGIATDAKSPYNGKRTPYNVAISKDEGVTWENVKTLEDDVDGWYCYTGVHFVNDMVMLGHSAGNRPKFGGLETTQITRFSLDWLYKTAATQPASAAEPEILKLKLLPPGPDNPRNSEADFVTLKDGRILMIYSHFTGKEGADESPCYLAARYSSDGGKTWTKDDVKIVPSEEAKALNIMSPSLLRLHDGRIALFYLRRNGPLDMPAVMRTSTDEGKTWSEPTVCIPEEETGYYVLNNDRAIQTRSGRLVLPVARHDDISRADKFNHKPITMCFLSDDAGKTWRRSTTRLNDKRDVPVALQEPGVVQLRDRRLMMFCRTHTGYIYRSFSSDDGDTWSPAHRYPGLYAPVSAAAIERVPTTGDLLLVWNNHEGIANVAESPYKGKRTPYNVAISKDDGATWENVKTLEDDLDGWYCYTAIQFVGDEVLLAHCAGNRPKSGGLETTQITRFSLDWLYKSPATQPAPKPLFTKGQPVKVFVLTGQSNSLGCTGDVAEIDITPGRDPLDEQIPFFWANRSTRAGNGPAQLYGTSGGKIVTLRAQQGEGVDPLFWGPEIAFGRTLAAAGKKNFMIVKASRGGGGNSYWLKGHTDDHMYRHVVETVQQAVKALPPGTEFEISALLYMQGESDSPAEAALSGERLRTLAANLRKDLPNAADMKMLIAGIALSGKDRDVIRAQQSALPAADATFLYVDTLEWKPIRYDGAHFNKPAKLELGKRLAEKWLEWEKQNPLK